jgi:hypothetical protein
MAVDQHGPTILRQCPHERSADAAAAAGDDCSSWEGKFERHALRVRRCLQIEQASRMMALPTVHAPLFTAYPQLIPKNWG